MFIRPVIFTLFFVVHGAYLCAEVAAVEVLELREAIDSALEFNLGLVTARYAPLDAADGVSVAEAAFDVSLFGSTSVGESQSAASASTLDSAVPRAESRQVEVGVEKRLSSGASVVLDSGVSRRTSNNNAALNPDYSSDVGVSVRQPLLRGVGRVVNLAPIARAKVQAEQSVYGLRSEILDVILEVEEAYWNLASARANRVLVDSRIDLAQNLLEENLERKRLGLITGLEVLQAETELLNQRQAAISADRAIEEFQDVLRRLMGRESLVAGDFEPIFVRDLPVEVPVLRSVDAVVRSTVESDLDARVQAKVVELERIDRMLARDALRLDLDVTGGLRYSGRDEDGFDSYLGAIAADGFAWNVGLEVRLPWGLRESKARLRQAERALERESVRLQLIKEQKVLAARNAWRAVDAGMKRVVVSGQVLKLNEESFEQVRARYGSGLVAYRQVLEAQRDFDAARSEYLSARVDTVRAVARLSRIDGTILERNGFSWDLVEDFEGGPDVDGHPLLNFE